MFGVELSDESKNAWLGTDGKAHACPTPDPDQAMFNTEQEALAVPIPDGWERHVGKLSEWEVSRILEMRR